MYNYKMHQHTVKHSNVNATHHKLTLQNVNGIKANKKISVEWHVLMSSNNIS